MHQRPSVRLVFLFLFFLLAENVPLWAGDTKYLVDSKGEASIKVGVKSDAVYKLAPADLGAYRQIRQRLADLFLAQPAAKSPKGVSLWGEAKAGSTISLGEPKHPNWPVPTYCYVHFNSIIERNGKAVWASDSPVEMGVFVNDPEACGFAAFGMKNCQGRRVLYEPNKVGEIQGFPLYRDEHGLETLILSRGHTPPLVPLTQEEFIGKDPSNQCRVRLEHHKAALAALSPAERRAPAMYLRNENPFDPDLASPGAAGSWPLVVVNPQWFDPALPRSAFQFIAVTFEYGAGFDPDNPKPDDVGSVESVRLSDMKRTTDWKAVAALLVP